VLCGRTDDGIGYLLIGAWSSEVDPEVVGRAIAELADTKAMVVDARPNSGGDERLAQQVAAWFVDGTKTYAKHRFRLRAGKDGFGPVEERKLTGNGPDRRYGKPIAVLTSRYVMSSNESFVMMLRQARDCVVVGQPTFGSSGNPKPFDLGNGVTAFVPSWQDLRLDETVVEGEGIAPDEFVPCTPDDLQARDPIFEKALELLRAKTAAAT
jgi:C-terminal processing protease CtpA/Prc